MPFDQSQARDSYSGIYSQTQFAQLSPTVYPMQRVGVDNGDGTLSLWWSNGKTWVRLDASAPRGPSLAPGPGRPWAMAGQRIVLAVLPGPYSITGGINTLIGLPGGAPFVPAGVMQTGAGGSILRASGVFTKIGVAAALNFDIRVGNTSSFADGQASNFNSGVATVVRFEIDILFTSPTTFKTFARYYYGGSSLLLGTDTVSGPLNTAATPTFINFGYNSATAPDGAQLEDLVAELLLPAYSTTPIAPVSFPISVRPDFVGMHADPSPV